MKNISLILIGITIGYASTLLLQRRDLSTYDLNINDMGGNILAITSKAHPELGVVITSILSDEGEDQGRMSSIWLVDQSGIHVNFNDRDSDGIWDDRSYSTTNTTYSYAGKSGFPTMIFSDEDEPLVRIDDQYFKLMNVDGEHFIEKGSELVEVEYIHHSQFKMKE